MPNRIYLDHNATTPPLPEVVDAVSRALREDTGNASSIHAVGQRAKACVDEARTEVARLIAADPAEVVFTCGGTEANNLALRGALEAARPGRTRLVVTAIEHEAVLATARALERRGTPVTVVPSDPRGVVDVAGMAEALGPDVALVSIMLANNETGVIQPVREIAALARAHGIIVHTDAVQAVGKIPVDVRELGVDLLSLAGHKFGGPQGAGALWIRRGVGLVSQMTGGRQERNRRAGTENIAALVGLGVAAHAVRGNLEREARRVASLRNRLEAGILSMIPESTVNGAGTERIGNTANISFDHVEAESLLIALDLEAIAVSTGSACSSGTLEPSHVLRAMGLTPRRVQSALRFSLGFTTTEPDIDHVLTVLPPLVERLRAVGHHA